MNFETKFVSKYESEVGQFPGLNLETEFDSSRRFCYKNFYKRKKSNETHTIIETLLCNAVKENQTIVGLIIFSTSGDNSGLSVEIYIYQHDTYFRQVTCW